MGKSTNLECQYEYTCSSGKIYKPSTRIRIYDILGYIIGLLFIYVAFAVFKHVCSRRKQEEDAAGEDDNFVRVEDNNRVQIEVDEMTLTRQGNVSFKGLRISGPAGG